VIWFIIGWDANGSEVVEELDAKFPAPDDLPIIAMFIDEQDIVPEWLTRRLYPPAELGDS